MIRATRVHLATLLLWVILLPENLEFLKVSIFCNIYVVDKTNN